MRLFLSMFLCVACLVACKPASDSWGTPEFIGAGVPRLDHPWSPAELAKAVEVLTAHNDHLPHYQDPSSGAVFAKLLENPPDDPAAPITERIGGHFERYGALDRASKLYASAMPKREVIELWGAILREASTSYGLFEPFLASFPPDDPSLPARRRGLADVNRGIGEMLIGATMVSSDSHMPDADRIAMLQIIEHAVPTLWVLLPATAQANMRDSLRAITSPASVGAAASAAVHAIPTH